MYYFLFVMFSLAQYLPYAFLQGRPHRITISDVTATEGSNLVFTVSLNRAANANIDIQWSTANNTATSGSHYTANSGTLTILSGQSAGTITISSLNHAGVCIYDSTSCALLDNLTVKCWGSNGSGRLGYGDTAFRGSTTATSGDNLLAVDLGTVSLPVQVSVGSDHSCARFANGGVKCWGEGSSGQLGRGNGNDIGDQSGEMGDSLAFINLGTGRTAKKIVAFYAATCAILDNGNVVCWGLNSSGQLGNGSTSNIGDGASEMGDFLIPVDLNGDRAIDISANLDFVCALLENSTVKCWGNNFWGQLGQGDSTNRGGSGGTLGAALPPVPISW